MGLYSLELPYTIKWFFFVGHLFNHVFICWKIYHLFTIPTITTKTACLKQCYFRLNYEISDHLKWLKIELTNLKNNTGILYLNSLPLNVRSPMVSHNCLHHVFVLTLLWSYLLKTSRPVQPLYLLYIQWHAGYKTSLRIKGSCFANLNCKAKSGILKSTSCFPVYIAELK